MKHILFVDDDEAALTTLAEILRSRGFDVTTASNVPDALELVQRQSFDVLLSDMNIGEPGDGFTIVSAVRKTQPQASTFIITGYPDSESALPAIRNQMDGYLINSTDPAALVDTLLACTENPRFPKPPVPTQRVSDVLRQHLDTITEMWLEQVESNPDLATIHLSRKERTDHIGEVITELIRRIDQASNDISPEASNAAQNHGRTRYQQGYTIPQIVVETRILQHTLATVIESNLLGIDLSTLTHDLLRMGNSHHALLELSIRAYQSEVPPSLQNSLSQLYRSAHLGVVICNEKWVTSANDAFLRMIGSTREEFRTGAIDWRAITPAEFFSLDSNGIEQLREYGVCVPYEKDFISRSGVRLPVMVGAVRLSIEPLEWAAYLVDLSDHRRAAVAERQTSELQAKRALVNQLAHEINNPLAAMTFTMYLMKSHSDVPEDVRRLLNDSAGMLDRISETVRAVLAAVDGDEVPD